ncbi:MAG: cyclic pyranopterin monophosphate synthase MoaC [Hyphomonadaceae bacterium]|nr:cyclic pyranopterin monophosphate synthase MoaC [Hyphomonadaceae bacterium]
MSKLTHIDEQGRARMVDVSAKPATDREAVAEGVVRMSAQAKALALAADSKKGDVRAAAEIAGIMAAKRTSDLIPLCHSLPLNKVSVEIAPHADGLVVTATARAHANTGVEMEALTAASVACLTIYDMLKAVDRTMSFDVRLTKKSGGASGDYVRA